VGYDEETGEGLKLANRYPLHCARDYWAVRAARAGTPIAVIQAQLGHGSPMLTLTKYGRFLPSATDRAKWEAEATRYEANRRASTNEG
jgi:integrase